MSISLRIKELRLQKKLSQIQFAKHLKVSQASVSQYENGTRSPDSSFYTKVCETYNVNLNWLLTGSGLMFQDIQPINPSILTKTIRLPIVGEIAAGNPCEIYCDEPLGHIDIPIGFLHFSPPYMVFRVSGRSMEPYILSGDLVICSQDWRDVDTNGKIMAFRTWEGITIKRLVVDYKNKTTWLMPMNHEFTPLPFNKDTEDITMIGILDIAIRSYNRDDIYIR
ncbi:MAG: XRE family transcriptional regulator [Kiritimatiellae bacterium]|nr:XRE family transcriptional regulator [Kiritimatiellia bacterium]